MAGIRNKDLDLFKLSGKLEVLNELLDGGGHITVRWVKNKRDRVIKELNEFLDNYGSN